MEGKYERTGKQGVDRKPNHEFVVRLSEDGRHWIFKDVTTWIVPVNYLGTILKNRVADKIAAIDLERSGSAAKGDGGNDRST